MEELGLDNHTGSSSYDHIDEFIKGLENRIIGRNICFLCLRGLDRTNRTEEHVIPRWLQKRFNLYGQEMNLLNATRIPYRKLTVPCCKECNEVALQPIEQKVKRALEKGVDGFRALDNITLFYWLGKILYGIIYKELFLSFERSDEHGRTIILQADLKRFEYPLFFLQATRKKVHFQRFVPGSFCIFKCQVPENQNLRWDFVDFPQGMFIGMRMDDVGLIGVIGDNGAHMVFEDDYKDIIDFPLHPLQFREVCAKFAYSSTLREGTSGYMISIGKDSPHEVLQSPPVSAYPRFSQWKNEEYAAFLSHYSGLPYEEVFVPGKGVASWLRDDSGSPVFKKL
jgi:hypothetical protein